MRKAETRQARGRRTLKNQLITGLGYLVAGILCLIAGLLTESKFGGILFGLAGAGIGPGALLVQAEAAGPVRPGGVSGGHGRHVRGGLCVGRAQRVA